MEDTTIAAISTAYGESGIGIVRMSGPKALDILASLFARGESGGDRVSPCFFVENERRMIHGFVKDPESGKILDEALCVYMKAPSTYTGEDVCEIQCHGSLLSIRNILALCLKLGAEPAGRGEFTKRAFLNGRMDLLQAEAVIDLIKAPAERAFDSALGRLRGELSGRVERIRNSLKEVLIDMTVNMDYPDEDIEEITCEKLLDSLSTINNELLGLLAESREGRRITEGMTLAITGTPNVGKSSLMNRFLREERSIVTDVPGTTRDTIEEGISLRGIALKLIDTAGMRDTEDPVEKLGVERSRSAFDEADLILLVLDGSRPLGEEDKKLLALTSGRNAIYVVNKTDLGEVVSDKEIRAAAPAGKENAKEDEAALKIVRTSLKTGEGFKSLEDEIEAFVCGGTIKRASDPLLSNVRQIDLAEKAQKEIEQAMCAAKSGEALDIVEINVRAAFDLLGAITGETAGDEIIDEIFSRFCLGK